MDMGIASKMADSITRGEFGLPIQANEVECSQSAVREVNFPTVLRAKTERMVRCDREFQNNPLLFPKRFIGPVV